MKIYKRGDRVKLLPLEKAKEIDNSLTILYSMRHLFGQNVTFCNYSYSEKKNRFSINESQYIFSTEWIDKGFKLPEYLFKF